MTLPARPEREEERPQEPQQELERLSRAEYPRDCVMNEHEELVGVVALELRRAMNLDPDRRDEVGAALTSGRDVICNAFDE